MRRKEAVAGVDAVDVECNRAVRQETAGFIVSRLGDTSTPGLHRKVGRKKAGKHKHRLRVWQLALRTLGGLVC